MITFGRFGHAEDIQKDFLELIELIDQLIQ